MPIGTVIVPRTATGWPSISAGKYFDFSRDTCANGASGGTVAARNRVWRTVPSRSMTISSSTSVPTRAET